MKAIVTGAAGFIGTALCAELLNQGHEVYALIRSHSQKREKMESLPQKDAFSSQLHILEMSLEEYRDGEAVFKDMVNDADVFYHLAWNGSSGKARNDFFVQESNIGYTADAIRLAKASGCKVFIGIGSQAEYGVIRINAVEENALPKPFMMYGAAKLAACHMGRLLCEQENLRFVWPRIYSVYGVGENEGTLLSYLIGSLKNNKIPELSPCENMWNFLEIGDCARLLVILGCSSECQGVYHVASPDTRVLRSFVKELRDIVSPEARLGFGMRKSDPNRTFWLEPDISKLKEVIAKECPDFEFTSFEEGIRRKMA